MLRVMLRSKMTASTPDKSQNLAIAARAATPSSGTGELRTFVASASENFSLCSPDDSAQFVKEAETLKGVTVGSLRRNGTAEQGISGSWVEEAWRSKPRLPESSPSTSLLISPEGEIAARYDKIHLFDVKLSGDRDYEESEHIQAGKKSVVAETPFRAGGAFDLLRSEISRALP